jgi:microcystin-dependent protein
MTQQTINYNEKIVGANHPTLSDTVNRALLIQHNSTGGHALIGTMFGLDISIKDADEFYVDGGMIDLSGEMHIVSTQLTKTVTGLSVSTTYHIYVKPPATGLALSATEVEYTTTAPTRDADKAAGYHGTNTTWRWIGWVRTDGSGNLVVAESVHSFNNKNIGDLEYYLVAEVAPFGFIEFAGATVSRTTYAELLAGAPKSISTSFGVGDGSTTFTLPDLRGRFPRVWANGSTNDPDRATRTDRGDGTTGDHPGTLQADQNKAHTHTETRLTYAGSGGNISISGIDMVTTTFNTSSSGGNQSNPKNIAVAVYCKYLGRY